jgi:seryl-tRNA synthetase
MAKDKAAFDAQLQAANLSAAEKARQLGEFNKQAQAQKDSLGKEIAALKGDLAEAQAKANAREKLSQDIAKALKNAGVEAEVNANTGDVTISFGKDYFDSGSAELHPARLLEHGVQTAHRAGGASCRNTDPYLQPPGTDARPERNRPPTGGGRTRAARGPRPCPR